MSALDRVDTWLYHLGDIDRRRADDIAATNADLVITEWASYALGERPYGPAMIDRMRGTDDDRLIVSYLSIGEAEDYRYYWQDGWSRDRPAWLGPENPEWEGNLKVRFWRPDWQAIILDYLDRIIDAGFNGVYLDIIDAFWFWEDRAPNAGIDYRAEMAEFVSLIRDHALERIAATDPGRDFVIIGQNGLDLLRDPTYRAAIDGIGVEDLRFYYRNGAPSDFRPTGEAGYRDTLDLIQLAERTGNQAFVVEYIPPDRAGGVADLLAAEAVTLGRMGVPLTVSPSRALDGIGRQPGALDAGPLPPLGPQTPTAGADFLRGTAGADRIAAGSGADRIEARGGADRVQAGRGNDTVLGGRGDDTLAGGRGDDLLHGQAGADRFLFRAGDGADTIRGFDPARDRIDLPDPGALRILADDAGVILRLLSGDTILLQGLDLGAIDTDILI